MEISTSSRGAMLDIVQALEMVVDGKGYELETFEKTANSKMNIDTSLNQTYTSVSSHHHVVDRASSSSSSASSSSSSPKRHLFDQMIPPLLKSGGGLGRIPQKALQSNLEPILRALHNLDAELLLGLEPAPTGPIVRDGRRCRPIYDQVTPPLSSESSKGKSCVRYLHIAEIPEQYSIGIFVFAPFSRIPLHDHPEMCVLSRVLYGDLQRLSLDLDHGEEGFEDGTSTFLDKTRRSSWLGSLWNRMESFRRKLPKGSKPAYKNSVDYLRAPDVTALYPYEGNLHEFVAGPDGAAVLDVLLPPYDNSQNRDCTFYEIQELTMTLPKPSGKDPCFIIPTGQPENFHCISGQYRDIGESDESD